MSNFARWVEILRTGNVLSPTKEIDTISRWLLVTRSCVFVMTIISGLVGGMLAIIDGYFSVANIFYILIILVGLVVAHAANNMANDYWDVKVGVDTSDYPRAKYAPHPILDNLVSENTLITAILVCYTIDLVIAVFFMFISGWQVLLFALAGVFLSVFYVAPPLKLKHRGLGELAIFLIWGPLITVGAYYVLANSNPLKLAEHPVRWLKVWLASIPYGLAVTTVILGKHIDKMDKDAEKGVKTLAVLLGYEGAKVLMRTLIIGFYLSIAIFAIFKVLPIWSLIALLSLPYGIRFMRTLGEPTPSTPQEGFEMAKDVIPKDLKAKYDPNLPEDAFPLWPLWYVVWGVWWTRIAGGLFFVGLLIGAIARAF